MNANGNNRTRWTDERLDRFADSVSELGDDIAELRERISETNDSVDGLRITAQALLQIAAQNQQADRERQEEIRNINERLDVQQGQIKVLLERLLRS
jgi:cell division septum initiation protein DivIVA